MTLVYTKGKTGATCDVCEEELKDSRGRAALYDREDFDILRDRLNSESWKTAKEDGEWHHYCPDCQ